MVLTEKLKPHALPLLILLALGFAVYAPSLGHRLLSNWDDNLYVTTNAAVRGVTPAHLKAAFTTFYSGNYAPLQIVSYMLDYTIWGMRPIGFILGNIVLHALSGLLYYTLVFGLTRRRLWAFLASFVFLMHPVQVESVAWVSQRKNVLAMFFFLCALHLYIVYRRRDRGKGGAFYAGSVVFFVLALFSKSVAVVLPLALLLYEFCFFGHEERKGWLARMLPYALAAAAVGVLTFFSQTAEFQGGRTAYHGGSPYATFLTMLTVFPRYEWMLFWPAHLCSFYDLPVREAVDGIVLLALLLRFALVGLAIVLYRWKRGLFFWFAFFYLGLLPVAQIIPIVTLMNDRYLYFPMLGGAAFLGGAMVLALDVAKGAWRKGLLCGVSLLLLALPLLSMRRAAVWQDAITIWSDAVGRYPEDKEAWIGLAEAFDYDAKLDLAKSAYLRALSLDTSYREALYGLGNLYMEMGDVGQSREFLWHVVNSHSDFADGFLSLGDNYYMAGEWTEAEKLYAEALRLDPHSAEALASLCRLYYKRGDRERGDSCYRRAVAAGGVAPDLAYKFAALEALRGNPAEALRRLEEAFSLGFGNINAVTNDRDLEQLRNRPDFRRVIEQYSKERI